jgi:hypothetical protein
MPPPPSPTRAGPIAGWARLTRAVPPAGSIHYRFSSEPRDTDPSRRRCGPSLPRRATQFLSGGAYTRRKHTSDTHHRVCRGYFRTRTLDWFEDPLSAPPLTNRRAYC